MENKAERRLLVAELAIKAYRIERGELPDRLDDLIPEYLPAVPTDPYTEEKAPLIYRRTDDKYLLYSVGLNGRDDGGEKVYWLKVMQGQGDIFYDFRDLDDPDS